MTVHLSAIKFLDFLAPPPILFPRPTLAHRDASRHGAASHGICTPHTRTPRLDSRPPASRPLPLLQTLPPLWAAINASNTNRRSISSLSIPVSRSRLCAQYHMLAPDPWLSCLRARALAADTPSASLPSAIHGLPCATDLRAVRVSCISPRRAPRVGVAAYWLIGVVGATALRGMGHHVPELFCVCSARVSLYVVCAIHS